MPINRYEDEGVANYWNDKYKQNYHPYLHGRRNKVLELISSLNLPEGATCLELGTGGGQNAVEYARLGLKVPTTTTKSNDASSKGIRTFKSTFENCKLFSSSVSNY